MKRLKDISPFTLEIIKNGLIVASEEMFYSWGRTAKSPVIYEVLDYAVGLIDTTGTKLVTQAPGIPGFTGVLDFAAEEVVNKWDDDIKPGDVFVSNVPYDSGTHLNDVTLIAPIFYEQHRLGFSVAKGHWSEVGGMHFGSWTSDSTEIFQEGLQLPCVKLYEKGEPNRDVIDLIRFNSRLPEFVLGDMYAQAASMKIAARRVIQLVTKYGLDSVLYAMSQLLEDGERYAKIKLSQLPKGRFKAEDWIDDDGITDEPIRVEAEVTITEDNFIVDFTGSGKQARGSINSSYPSTVSGVRMVYMAITDPHAHPNGGFFSPIKVIAPKGTIFNPERPAPTSTFWEGLSYAADLVWKALAPQAPETLSAGHFLSIEATILGGVNDKTGEPFAIVEPQPGGWGAGYDLDGESGLVACGDGETYIASSEVYERRMPILVETYALNTHDGTGHGRQRGGFGVRREYRVLCREANLTVTAGRSKFPPWGVEGGMKGTPNYAVIYTKGQKPIETRKIAAFKMERGDLVSLRTGGGGGWGDPFERDIEKVWWDILNEYITKEQALSIYGVAIDPVTLEIDAHKTRTIRENRIRKK
ncbi:hydantoinase B/oxoprolinase family protein [Candidatus Bathyarchaeota archaeon]|nr:hydantoinase B/oxoprolinase family protein [Candidatus Bathyarchaeota archaeon]